MRYRLRTLLIVAAFAPAVLAIVVSLLQLAYYRLNPSWPVDNTEEIEIRRRAAIANPDVSNEPFPDEFGSEKLHRNK